MLSSRQLPVILIRGRKRGTHKMVLTLSLIIATIVAVPWLIAFRFVGAAVTFCGSFFFALIFVYFGMPSIAGPLWGGVGTIAVFFLFISGVVATFTGDNGKDYVPTWVAGGAAVIYVLMMFGNSTFFRAQEYARLVPQIEQREWSADFQPKDPRHFRVSSPENATFLAGRAIGQATTLDRSGQPNPIGSQFKVYDEVSSVQIIKRELWTIVPIDWNGWGPQFSGAPGIPGYIKVAGENPIIPAEYVSLKPGKEFRYTPEAIWGYNLDRLIWRYHPDKYIADKHLEIDEDGEPHYIISIAEPTIAWWGEKVTGALIINPITGAGVEKFIPLGEVPSWVDRVEAEYIVHRNIDYHGKYAQGWWNRSIYGSNVLAATKTHFGYGSSDEPVFATGITAHNTAMSGTKIPDSLVAVYYTNTRTGKTVEYMLQGGATENRAIEQCNLIGDVRNRQYHGSTPQLYNVYGHISYVVPLQNASHAYAGVCIVSVMNLQVIAWGHSAHEAELAFKQMIVANSSQMAIEGTRKLSTMAARVTRVGSMSVNGSTTYFFQLEGMKHLFTVPVTASVKVPVTQVGDEVWVEYYNSGEAVMPVNKFDNKSFELDNSLIQAEVEKRALEHVDEVRTKREETRDVQSVLDNLPVDQRELLKRNIKK